MPWLEEAMKDAVGGDTLRGGAKQPLIRRFPNGETLQLRAGTLSLDGNERTLGSKTFQYQVEKRTIVIS